VSGLLSKGGAHRARQAGQKYALLLLAAVLILPGIVMVTHSAWVAIALVHGVSMASLVTGAAWIGAGLIVIVLARQPAPPLPPPLPVPATLPMAAMIEAFLQGLALARAPGRRRD